MIINEESINKLNKREEYINYGKQGLIFLALVLLLFSLMNKSYFFIISAIISALLSMLPTDLYLTAYNKIFPINDELTGDVQNNSFLAPEDRV